MYSTPHLQYIQYIQYDLITLEMIYRYSASPHLPSHEEGRALLDHTTLPRSPHSPSRSPSRPPSYSPPLYACPPPTDPLANGILPPGPDSLSLSLATRFAWHTPIQIPHRPRPHRPPVAHQPCRRPSTPRGRMCTERSVRPRVTIDELPVWVADTQTLAEDRLTRQGW